MKKAIFVNALRGIRYAGEVAVLADMLIHFCNFSRQYILPRLCPKKKEVADVVVDEGERSE